MYDEHLDDNLLVPRFEEELMFNGLKRHYFFVEDTGEKIDIVIDGLGWFSFEGNKQEIEVFTHESVGVKLRKAII